MMYYVIPARYGSKGFPEKNRILFDFAKPVLDRLENVIVTSDDPEIVDRAISAGYDTISRCAALASDTASVRNVLLDVIAQKGIEKRDIIVMLYLTYPQRKREDIDEALKFFVQCGSDSMLCKKAISGAHPYLMMYERPRFRGRQLVRHGMYRRQDYPPVFEISHFIFIARAGEIGKLNQNLYNRKTAFMPIDSVVDVDYEKDLAELKK